MAKNKRKGRRAKGGGIKYSRKNVAKNRQLVLPEYYTLPFAHLHDVLHADLFQALHIRPAEKLRLFLENRFGPAYPKVADWEDLFQVLTDLESEMARILATRSVMFWLHVYRRIAPFSADERGQSRDWVTTHLIRDMVESAIQKYGAIDDCWEFALSNEVDPSIVLGGWFSKSLELLPDRAHRDALASALLDQPALVIVDFDANNLSDIYEVEGLAFEYWQITAKLRAIGKGAEVMVLPGPMLCYNEGSTPWDLMASFDARAQQYGDFDNSSLGVWIEPDDNTLKNTFTFAPNTRNEKVSSIFVALGLQISVPPDAHDINYVPHRFDAYKFCERHAYIAERFEARKGFSLKVLPVVFECLSDRLINFSHPFSKVLTVEESAGLSFFNLCRRAYSLKNDASYDFVERECIKRVVSRCKLTEEEACAQVAAILASLKLSHVTRSVIGLWSRGPRFPIMKVPGGYLFDFYGIHRYFHNLFVGVREDNTDRGYVFEDAFRTALTNAGIVLEQRDFTFQDGTKAEADAVFYVGDKLVVVDCLSVWRPLDFDIARPATMNKRQAMLDEKITKSLARVAKLRANPVGRNFDFSNAREFVTLVATPFTEWLWDRSDRLWHDASTPRVMRANELIDWTRSQIGDLKEINKGKETTLYRR